MKYIFGAIIFIHGLIHIPGFVKGFGFREVKELTLPISTPMGILWLVAAGLIMIYGVVYFANYRYSWLIGFFVVAVSQILIILFWKDARFGTFPNIAILAVSLISYGHYNFQNLVQAETTDLLSQIKIPENRIVTENDINGLPEPVKNWLHHSGSVGKPYISAGKVMQKAEMKMKPGQEKWFNATAIQYSTIDNPAFIWTVDVKMNSLINFQGRDKFVNGKGEMLIKLYSLVNVVNEQGEKLNEGTLQRYLGEMVWFPSLALSPYITWQEINDNTATATMNYNGTKGSGTFYFNSDGDFIKFTALRYMGNESDAERHEWVLSVDEHKIFEGIKVPSKMTATWKLENEDWTWLKLEIQDIKYNENLYKPAGAGIAGP
ncbi:MAG: hypothetical protein RQ761_05600 [Bacteroidales bacterium]|nr:hypothetical protein [Bacteroidales bacterium]